MASFLRRSALLRRRPGTVAAHSRAGRPSASVSVERPPSAAQHWRCVEVVLTEFKNKAFRELSGVLDFHIRGVDIPVQAGRVCRVWKQLVEDNLAIAARMRYPRKWPRALRKWSRTFRALVVRTANWYASCGGCRASLAVGLDVCGSWKPAARKQLPIPSATRR